MHGGSSGDRGGGGGELLRGEVNQLRLHGVHEVDGAEAREYGSDCLGDVGEGCKFSACRAPARWGRALLLLLLLLLAQ